MSEAMSTSYSSSHSYPCHVLFQFIFVSFLRTQETIQNLKVIRSELEICQESQSENKKKLVSMIENLAGISSPFHNGFSWDFTLGLLTGLKNESTLFQKNYNTQIPEAALISKQATSSWFFSIELLDLASRLPIDLPLHDHKDFLHFLKLEARLTAQLKKLGNTIIKTLMHFSTNENVLLCLLHRQDQLDAIYGKYFTAKLFKKMKFNTEKVYHFIFKAYSKRGFADLISTLKPKLAIHQSVL